MTPSHCDVKEATDHIRALLQSGMSTINIAKRSGVARSTIQCLLRGQYASILQSTSDAILSATVELGPNSLISGAPIFALMDEILASGKSKRWTARALGRDKWSPIRTERVTAKYAERVRTLHASVFGYVPEPIILKPRRQTVEVAPRKLKLSQRDPSIAARWAALDLSGIGRGAA